MQIINVLAFAGVALAVACGRTPGSACCVDTSVTPNTYSCAQNSGLYCATTSSGQKCECPAGQINSSGNCVTCPNGYYCPGDGTKVQCGPGTYSAGGLNYACNNCPAGTHNTAYGSTSSNACKTCTKGTYSGEGQGQCTPCGNNAQSNSQFTGCTALCGDGNGFDSASNRCQACTDGTFHNAAYDAKPCQPCPAGTYAEGSYNTACTPCPAGTYYGSTGAINHYYCKACNTGYTTKKTGATSENQCVPATRHGNGKFRL